MENKHRILQYTGRFIIFSVSKNTKHLRRTLHTVAVDIDSSLAAVPVDFFRVCRKLAQTRSTSSLAIDGRPLDFYLHRHPVSVSCLSVGGSFAYLARNARCTVTTDLLVWYSYIQNDFFPGAAIFSLHIFASPSGRNMNYDGKQLTGIKIFELFFLSVQVS